MPDFSSLSNASQPVSMRVSDQFNTKIYPLDYAKTLFIKPKTMKWFLEFLGEAEGYSFVPTPASYSKIKKSAGELKEALKEFGPRDMVDIQGFIWACAPEKGDQTEKLFTDTVRYWKIAPGENAWEWSECRQNGYIAMGWEAMGDISSLTRQEFNSKVNEMANKGREWTEVGLSQLWTFAHDIRVNDRIVANRGTTEVVGFGTVSGPYQFIPNIRHGHRRNVRWDDTTTRRVSEPGWRRTVVELDKDKFQTLLNTPPIVLEHGAIYVDPNAAFAERTFDLLAELHKNPRKEFYAAHREDFGANVEEPFQRLFKIVAGGLPKEITARVETEKGVFSRILKNDWGRGGAWDFYWGAFYPKGGKRIQDAQLFMVIDQEALRYGFYIGDYGKAQRERFLRNCRQNQGALKALLGNVDREGISPWQDWFKDEPEGEIRFTYQVQKEKVLKAPSAEIAARITQSFKELFPLILLSISDEPMAEIEKYGSFGDEKGNKNAAYLLEQCAADTGFDVAILERWLRAIERKKQAVIYGPPGTGKTYLAEHLARHLIAASDGFHETIQFHPSFAYEDFIQGIRPQSDGDGRLKYPLVPGRFLQFCEEAESRTGRCVLIIDEINRANLSRVFGELMFLLEYRDREMILSSGSAFRVPSNVRIIGTMNTADRSIALVDHALRRRFAFLALYPDYELLRRFQEKKGFPAEGLVKTLQQLNKEINDKHYEIGVTFFLQSDLAKHLQDIWRMEIEPYLEEYFFDQPEKVEQFRWTQISKGVLAE